MKRILVALLLTGTAPAYAVSPFDGVWIWDAAATQLPSEPDVYRLKNDRFMCQSCPTPYEVPADGQAHPVTSQPTFDTVAVVVENAETVRLSFGKAGRRTAQTLFTINRHDGGLLTESTDFSAEMPLVTRIVSERAGNWEKDDHALSGAWRRIKIESASDSATTVRLKMTERGIAFSDPTGFAYRARFDGKDYPVQGIGPGRMVSVRRLNSNSFEETQKQDGKVISVILLTVAPNGRTANYVFNDLAEGVTSRGTLHKQPDHRAPTIKAPQ